MLESIESITFNGINLVDMFTDDQRGVYLVVNEVRGRGILGIQNTTLDVASMNGVYISGTRTPVRYLEVDITMKGESFEDLRKRIERLNEILDTGDESVEISFSDEPDRTYIGKLDGVNDRLENSKIYQATITILCADPFKYGPEKVVEPPSDTFNVENPGTAPAKPIFELTVKEPATFAMVSDGERYNMIGQPADVETEVVDERILVMNETGGTLDTWQTASGSTGRFRGSDNGIFVDSYGSGTGWHGPRLIKEIDPLEDFEIEFVVNARTNRADQTFRISTNYYDEYNNELGMLRLWDLSIHRNHKVVEARVGPYVGQHVNYPISSRNYNIQDQLVWYGLIRVVREGNLYTFYVARIDQRGRHVNTLTQTFFDANNEFAGRLRYVRIDIAKYAGTETATEVSIDRISVYKRNRVEEDQTPYIAYPGDIFTFDHLTNELLLNGEDVKSMKDFGGEYFDLPKGYTALTILPEGAFDTKVRFRPRYR